jgi:hypothetical protein
MKRETFIELAKKAEQIAECVGDTYKCALFAKALDELIKDHSSGGEKVSALKSQASLNSQPENGSGRPEKVKTILSSHLGVGEGRLILEKGETLERSLLVMDIADRQFGLSELMPPEIAKVLSQNLGVKTTPNAVSMALKKETTRYVIRHKEAQGFVYALTPAGRKYVEEFLAKIKGGRGEAS